MDLFETWLVNLYIADGGISSENCLRNTIPAYQKAVNAGYAILLDVQELSDGTIICYKDRKLQKHNNQNGYVSTLTSFEIENLKLNDGNTIPTFEDALKQINGKVPVIVNLVNNTFTTKLESAVAKILKGFNGDYAVTSFNPTSIEYFKSNYPDMIYGIKVEDFKEKVEGNYKTKLLKKLKYNKLCEPKFIMYYAEGLPNRYVKKYKELPLIATDIKTQEEYLKVIKHSDNITFNDFEPEI